MGTVPIPYQPMLLSSAPCPPAGDRWVHEPNLDGWRCIAQVQDGKVRLWAREGLEWSPLLPELSCLADLGDLVLDGELVALSPDGRPDLDLLSTHMTGRPPTCRSACTSSTSSAWVSLLN